MKNIIKKRGGFTQTPKLVSGFMMVEVLIVASIMTLVVIAALSVAQKSILVSRQAVHTSQASFLLEEGAENVRILRDNGWNNISSYSDTPHTVGIFTRTVNIANVNRDNATGKILSSGTNDVGTKLITITVSWNEAGKTLSKTLSFYIMDIFS